MSISEKYLPTISQKHLSPILVFTQAHPHKEKNKAYFILWMLLFLQLAMKKTGITVHEFLQCSLQTMTSKK